MSKKLAVSAAMTIEQWPIEKLRNYKRNPRIIPEAAIEKVAQSLKAFGWQQPVVVDERGIIIVGHTRVKAAKSLGLTHVPVKVATDLTPEQVKQYRIMDNRSNEETLWDNEILGQELKLMQEAGIDLMMTGFSTDEQEALLKLEEDPEELVEASEQTAPPESSKVSCPECGHHFDPATAAVTKPASLALDPKNHVQDVDPRSPGDILREAKRRKKPSRESDA